MYFAVCITSYGYLQLVGQPRETKQEVIDNFADAWAAFNAANSYSYGDKAPKQYGIAHVVDGIEMTAPPTFAVVPMMPALPKAS